MNDGGMNEYLADMYGTTGDAEDLQKAAEAELLAKLAEDDDINLDDLSDEEIQAIAEALGVEAEDDEAAGETGEGEGEAEEGSEESADEAKDAPAEMTDGQKLAHIQKVAEANDIDISQLSDEEFAQLAAFALDPEAMQQAQTEQEEFEAKFAEADFIGRVMAHAQFDEMRKISAAVEAQEKSAAKGRVAKGAKEKFLEAIRAARAKAKDNAPAIVAGGGAGTIAGAGASKLAGLDALVERRVIEVLAKLADE